MRPLVSTTSAIAVSALLLFAAPAIAGKADRARTAIAEASAKVDAANKVGATGEVPHLQAQAALRAAKEDLSAGHKERAFDEANRASQLADTALGQTQKIRAEDEAATRANAEAAAAAAQQDAAAANARADAAQQAAASAAADAAAARAAPPVILPAPAPTTVVTTETTKSTSAASTTRPKKKVVVVKRSPATTHAVTEKTTTTVSTQPN